VIVTLAVLRHHAHLWIAEAADPKPPGHEAPERTFSPKEGSLMDDIWGKDWDVPTVMAPFAHRALTPYRATDFFSDRNVAELAEAGRDGDVAKVDALVAQGVNVNATGNLPQGPMKNVPMPDLSLKGLTPLIYAMSGNTVKGFQRLLERGADPNIQTCGADSAITLATRRKDPAALKILLAHGGNPNLRARVPAGITYDLDPDPTIITPTPIYIAGELNRAENARLLVKAGADVNVRSYDDATPLIWAADRASYDVMYVLLEAGADIRPKDDLGFTLVYHILFDEKNGRLSEEYVKGAASRQKCIDWLEKKGVDWAKEKREFAEFLRRSDEKSRREFLETMPDQFRKEYNKGAKERGEATLPEKRPEKK
jgi:hypothetical protein